MRHVTRMISALLATTLLAGLLVFPGAAGTPGFSPWAEKEMAEAIRLGLKGENYYYDYSGFSWDNISRKDFARDAAWFLSHQFRFDLNDPEMEPYCRPPKDENGLERPCFTDINDTCVNVAYNFGVIQGRGDGIFDPDAPITREEAAVMLYNTYLAYAKNGDANVPELNLEQFADKDEISPWARQAVSTMVAWNVMAGLSGTEFGPKSNYTYEQCWVTLLRLYKNAPEGRLQGSIRMLRPWEETLEEFRGHDSYNEPDKNMYQEHFFAETEQCAVIYGGVVDGRYDSRSVWIFYKNGGRSKVDIPDLKYDVSPERFRLSEDKTALYCVNDRGVLYKVNLLEATKEIVEAAEPSAQGAA